MTPDALAQVHAAAFLHDRPWTADEFASLLAQDGVHLCGDIRSFAIIRVVLDEAELLTLATDPLHRRQGLAQRALTEAQTTAVAAGAVTMFLEVAEDNDAAKHLYETQGYTQIARRPRYYGRGAGIAVAALILQKALHELPQD